MSKRGRKDWDPRAEGLRPRFVEGYLEAAFLTTPGAAGEYSRERFEPRTLEKLIHDANMFVLRHGPELMRHPRHPDKAGWAFWMSRNDFGMGFRTGGRWGLHEAAAEEGPYRLEMYRGLVTYWPSHWPDPRGAQMSGRKDWDPRARGRRKAALPYLSDETERALREAFGRPPLVRQGPWSFEYEHPGYFVYTHDETGRKVYFTPDFNEPGYVDIQIVEPGEDEPSWFDSVLYHTPLTPAGLFDIVQRYLPARRPTAMSGRKDWDPRHRRRGSVLRPIAPDLQDYLDAYLDTALMFTNDVETGESLERYTTRDIAPETMEKMLADAFDFLEQYHEEIGHRLSQAGHDFWRTRNDDEHGFGDGDWPARAGSRLVRGAKRFGPFPLKVGPDGKIHHVPTGSSAAMSGRKDWDPRRGPIPWTESERDAFVNSYLQTALWSSSDPDDPQGGEFLDENYDVEDFDGASRQRLTEEAEDFMGKNWEDIKDGAGRAAGGPTGGLLRAGHDFWLTRNGHGAGFWDGDWPKEIGRRLTDASKAYGEVHLWVEDGKIHAE